MTLLLLFAGLVVVILVVTAVDRYRYPHGHEASAKDIRDILQAIIDGKDPYAVDDFVCGSRYRNPRFEAIRDRISELHEEYPPRTKDEFFGPEGIEVIRGYIRELEREAEQEANANRDS